MVLNVNDIQLTLDCIKILEKYGIENISYYNYTGSKHFELWQSCNNDSYLLSVSNKYNSTNYTINPEIGSIKLLSNTGYK